MEKPLGLPVHGAANNTTFFKQPELMAPPTLVRNVRPFDSIKDRPRIGQRPGLKKKFATRLGGGAAGQAMGVVSRAKTATGLQIASSMTLDGSGRGKTSAALAGQVWGLKNNFGMFLSRHEDVTPTSPDFPGEHGPAAQPVVAVDVSPDGTKLVYASNYVDSDTVHLVSRITCIDARTGALLWSHRIARVAPPSNDAYTNNLCCTADYCFIATNQFVRTLSMTDGTQVGAEFNCNGWAEEAIAVCLTWDKTHLLVAFNGSTVAISNGYPGPNPYNLLLSGVKVRNGKWAQHFRTGVMKCIIQPPGSLPAIYGTPLSTQLPLAHRYYDGPTPYNPHNYCRLSEQLPRKPGGGRITAVKATPDGGFVVAHTSGGWGPNNDYGGVPQDSPVPNGQGGFTTISKFSSLGDYQWGSDAFSILEIGDNDAARAGGVGPWYNDIPTGPPPGAGLTNYPSVMCLAVGSDGTIFVGGRRISVGAAYFSAMAIRPSSDGTAGLPIWTYDLGGIMLENGLAVGGDDGNPIFCGARNSSWAGSGGAAVHLWKLDKNTGEVRNTFDLATANIAGLGVCSRPSGEIYYVTDKV